MAKNSDPSALETYKVVYRGGLAHLPKPKVGEIVMKLKSDSIEFEPGNVSKKFWPALTIPYKTSTASQLSPARSALLKAFSAG